MFGYINVNGKQLSEENKKTYQSYYCGLCRELFNRCGSRGRLVLSFDMTFLVVLLTGLYENDGQPEHFTCGFHPVTRHESIRNEATEYAAAMNVLLAYHNMEDDWADERNVTKKTMASLIRKDYEKAAAIYPRQAKAVEDYMKRLAGAEAAKEHNIDLVAGMTGEMLGEIFAWKQDEWTRELKTLGFYMGKFIYLMDAYEDLDKDEKKKQYNPLLYLRKENKDNYETLVRLMMTSMMSECARSFERLPILLHADILRNILYSGVWTRYEYIQLKKKKRNKK